VIHIPHFAIGQPDGWFALPSERAWVYTVSISRIVPTQAWLIPEVVERYQLKTRMVDGDGQLPFGVRFAGSVNVYLIDGHHRWYSCLLRGRRRFRLLIDDYPVTYTRAMLSAYLNREPAPHARRALVPVPYPYQQLQFAWQ
jgi:hypothetical protein